MTKLVNFKNGSLDCYSKSIQDFIAYLKNNLLFQIQECKNDKNYTKYIDFLNGFEKRLMEKDVNNFIKKYFNNNRDENILLSRENIISQIVAENKLLLNFRESILKEKFTTFFFRDLLVKENFEFQAENQLSSDLSRFDEVIFEKEGNLKIYLEYKISLDYIFVCFFLSDNYRNDENSIYKKLQNFTKFIEKNINNSNLIELEMENLFYIRIKRNYKGNDKKIFYLKEEKEISANILKYLNDELIKELVRDEKFGEFLKTFQME